MGYSLCLNFYCRLGKDIFKCIHKNNDKTNANLSYFDAAKNNFIDIEMLQFI